MRSDRGGPVPPLPEQIRQLHVTGGRDENVPAALVARAVATQPGAELLHFAGLDHACCWPAVWGRVLDRLVELVPATGSR